MIDVYFLPIVIALSLAPIVLHVIVLHALTLRGKAQWRALTICELLGLVCLEWYLVCRATHWLIHAASVALFLGCIVLYVEARFLFNRGFSMRMLVDLRSRGGHEHVDVMKNEYGDGRGMQGLLDKRVESVASLGWISFDGTRVGPLTFRGKVFVILTSGYRKLLCLHHVG